MDRLRSRVLAARPLLRPVILALLTLVVGACTRASGASGGY